MFVDTAIQKLTFYYPLEYANSQTQEQPKKSLGSGEEIIS